MANLIGTIIGIAFCALLLVAGANFIAPKAFVEHNQAAANTAQVSALITDYSNLAMATGHRPTYADYASVYAGGKTANANYTNDGTTITTSATMAYTNANGQSVPIGTWKFMPGCGTGSGQDCFCLTVPAGASDVTYQATRISAYNQMNSPTQSRIEYSTDKCASGAPVTNPVVCGANAVAGTCWPSTTPKTAYYLTVRLNNTGSGSTTDGAGPTGPSSTPIDGVCATKDSCASGTLANQQTIAGAYTTYTWDCQGSAGGQDDKGGGCSATDGSCSTLDTCLSPGTEVNGANNATGPTWTCNGTNGGSPASCQAANGLCSTTTPNTCAEGTLITLPLSTITATGDIWGCAGSNGGSSQTGCTSTNGICSTTSPGTCTSGTAAINYDNASGESWNCNGNNGGTSQTNCISTNAVCDPVNLGKCTSGNPSPTTSPAPGYTTTWTCTGTPDGTPATASCSATNAVCDETNPSVTGKCLSGNPSATSTSGTNTIWTCTGTYGSTASCSLPTNPGSDGVCGTTGLNSCADPSNTVIPFGTSAWFCHGTDGHNSPLCSIGVCGSTVPNCGVFSSLAAGSQGDSNGNTTWTCLGNNGANPTSCSVPDGACNNAVQYGCIPSNVTASNQIDNGTTSTWNCPAPNNDGGATSGQCSFADTDSGCDCGGTIYASGTSWGTDDQSSNEPCTQCDPSDHGGFQLCGTTSIGNINTCTNGVVTSTYETITCVPHCNQSSTCTTTTRVATPPSCTPVSGGGSTPVNGACGATAPNCSAGTLDLASVTDSGGFRTWVCDGSNGGSNTSPGQCSVPDAQCDNTTQYGCKPGSPIPSSENDTNGISTWSCAAPNNDGGATSGQCSMADPVIGTYCPTYSACSTSCGSGTQSVTYACTDQNGNPLPSSDCPGMPANTTRACSDYAGCTYSIPPADEVYDQSICEAYCTGVTLVDYPTWDGTCIRSDGTPVASSYCTPPPGVPCLGTILGCSQAAKAAEQVDAATYSYAETCIGSNGCGTGTRMATETRCYGGNSTACQNSLPGPQSCTDYSACTYTAIGSGNSFTCKRSDGTFVDPSYCTPPSICSGG